MSASSTPGPFQPFYDRQAPAVLRFLRAMLASHDADDCFQETFIAALSAWDRFDGAAERAWVLRIARNKALDRIRRARSRDGGGVAAGTAELEKLSAPLPGPAQQAFAAEAGEQLWALVAGLSPALRAATVLRYALDLPFSEVGAVLGCSEDAARQRNRQALVALREAIERSGYEHR